MLFACTIRVFEPVLIATIVVFIHCFGGNFDRFWQRFLSALMSAILLPLCSESWIYFGYGSVSMSVTMTPSASAPAQALNSRSAKQKCCSRLWLLAT